MRTIMKGVHGIAALGHFVPVTTDMNQLASKENRIKRCQSGLTRSSSGHADSEFLALLGPLLHHDFDVDGCRTGCVIEFITNPEDTATKTWSGGSIQGR